MPHVLVRKLEAFVPLFDVERKALHAAVEHARSVEARITILQAGSMPKAVTILLEGIAACSKMRPGGQRQILTYLMPGDLHDLDTALIGSTDVAIETMSPCRIATLPLDRFQDMLEQHPRIGHALRLCKLADEALTRERMVGLGSRSALERTAQLLCEILFRLQAVGLASPTGCDLPITQSDLADTLGLSNVHMNRTLQALRGEGLIELRGKRLVVLDLPRFRTLAEFSPKLFPMPPARSPAGFDDGASRPAGDGRSSTALRNIG